MSDTGIGQNHALTPRIEANAREMDSSLRSCDVCGGKFSPYRRTQDTCSPRCRLLRWAARELLKAYREGKINGLRGLLEELAEVVRGER